MNENIFAPVEDATPIQPDDQKKLIPTWITTRDDLNLAEARNITRGLGWARRRRPKASTIVSEPFSRRLHRAMFGDVWTWAGSYREVELEGIGVPRWQIATKNAELFDQFRYWVDKETFDRDEVAVRFHHQLVVVHAFTNGNGRHSRMMADLLLESLGTDTFSWGTGDLGDDTSALRRTYIDALRAADQGDLNDLLKFARS